MDIKTLKEKLNLTLICGDDLEREVTGCYCGDLLSWVMSRAQEGDAWLTVMGNVNSIGVAVLADVACIILTENAALDEEALKRAEQNGVIILTTEKNSYRVAAEISRLI
ncbi:MAG TPA: DRTGG domain-containing protein [Oscillospiraceae bacterium]|nr:DRTGG domain-containing protein [Oscillospiraceae bacterium]